MTRAFENGCTGTVAEQNAGRAILPVNDGAHFLGADDQRGFGRAGHDQTFSGAHRVEPASAGGADIERSSPRRTELGLDVDSSRRKKSIRCGGAENDDVDLSRMNASLLHRDLRCIGRHRAGRPTVASESALDDAATLEDPFMRRLDAERTEA